MEGVDSLREWSHRYDNTWIEHESGNMLTTVGTSAPVSSRYTANEGKALREMLDAIEAEVAERYMELPVDRNDSPVHVGASVDVGLGSNPVHEVVGVGSGDTIYISMRNGTPMAEYASICEVVTSVEDVLRDFTDAILAWNEQDGTVAETGTWSEVAARYISKLRVADGGDE